MIKEKTIFICSSVVDIGDILYHIDLKKSSDFKIIVTTNQQVSLFLKSIFGDNKVIFLGSSLTNSPRNPFLWVKEIVIILYLKFLLRNHTVDKVYFYAPLYDLIGCFMVVNIFNNSEILLRKKTFDEINSKYQEVKENSLLNRLYSKVYGFTVNSYSNYRINIFGNYIPGLALKDIEIFSINKFVSIEKIKSVQRRYSIKYTKHSIDKSIIILDQAVQDMSIIKNFNVRIEEINNIIKPYKIFIKEKYSGKTPEPNTVFSNAVHKKLDAKFAAEYYDFSKSDFIISIYSSAIVWINHERKLCLLDMFDYYDDKDREQIKDHLNDLTNDIIYPSSIKELRGIIFNER